MSDTKLPADILPILLAGGEGSRLRPITSDLPKPLIPVDGTPAICRILDTLAAHGAARAVITVRYRADDIIGLLGSSYAGIHLFYSREDSAPRGTAGGVRDAWDTYAADTDTDALVISGDAVFNCDLAAFTAFHRRCHADASLLCTRVPEPGAFGIVSIGDNGRITGFSEKPCAAETLSDTVNTGIYCLRRAFLSQIPAVGMPDFGQDIFPHAGQQGGALYAFESEDYWCDVGSHSAYLACSLDISAGRIQGFATPRMRNVLPPNITDCSVGQKCFIPSTASVRGSILFDGVTVGTGASVTGSILCADVQIGDGVIIEPGCVIGRGCTVGDRLHLPRGTRLEPGTVLVAPPSAPHTKPSARFAAQNAFDGGTVPSSYLSDIGYLLAQSTVPQPETAVAFARALAAFAEKEHCTLFLCCAENTPDLHCIAGLVCDTLACVLPSGPDAVSAFCADDTLPLSAARMPSLPLPDRRSAHPVFRAVFLHRGGIPCAAVFDDTGLYPTRQTERTLDACFADALSEMGRPKIPDTAAPHPANTVHPLPRVHAADLCAAYIARYAVPNALAAADAPFLFSCGGTPDERLLSDVLCAMGGAESVTAPIHFSVPAPSEECGDILCPLTVSDLRESPIGTYRHWTLLSLLAACRQTDRLTPRVFPTLRSTDTSIPDTGIPDTSIPGDVRPPVLSVPVCAPDTVRSDCRYSHSPSVSDRASEEDPVRLSRRYAALEAEDAVLLARDIAMLCAAAAQPIGTMLQSSGNGMLRPTFRRYGFAASVADPAHPLTLSASLSALTRGKDHAFSPAVEGVLFRHGEDTVRIVATRDRNFRIIADAHTTEAAETLFRFAKDRLLCTVRSGQPH